MQWCASNHPVCCWKGLGTSDVLSCVSHTMQSALESGQGLGSCRLISVQPLIGSTISVLSISSAVWILDVLCCVYWQFLSNRSQPVMAMVVGVMALWRWRWLQSNVVSGVPQDSVLGPLGFLLSTSERFSILEYKLISHAADSTLMAVVPSLGVRVTVTVTDVWPWQGSWVVWPLEN